MSKKKATQLCIHKKKNYCWVRKALLVWDIWIIRILLTIPDMQRKQINLTPVCGLPENSIELFIFCKPG